MSPTRVMHRHLPRREDNGEVRIQDECDIIENVNKLHTKVAATGKMLDISLPQIVVVGGQSGGKSSVIEGIVGREFLPRGTGTVTRRPTVIHLYPSEDVYAIFDHKKNEKFTDFEDVKNEIKEETLREPGAKGFSPKPIVIKIYVPKVLKLSLVDLPGVIQTAVDDQPEETIDLVRNMVLEYVRQPNTIILAVIPGNQDLANSVALKIAKEVDPERERTIGVVTKLDIMDAGTNAQSILENKELHLAKGYVGIVNRSQMEIASEKDISYALEKEKEFFLKHPAYSHMADRMGIPYLRKRLHVELKKHIRKTLPSVKKEIMQKLNALKRDLKEYEALMSFQDSGSDAPHIQSYLMRLIEIFKDDVQVKLFGHSENTRMDKLTAGSRINYHIYTKLQEILYLPTSLTEENLLNLMSNIHGFRNVLSVPSLALEAACGEIMKNYQELLEDFVDGVTEILMETVDESVNSVCFYPHLKTELLCLINEAISKATEETKDLLGKYLKAERAYCNVYRWDFASSKLENGLPCSPVKIWSSDKSNSSGSNSVCSSSPSVSSEESFDVESIGNKLKTNETAKKNTDGLASVLRDYLELIQKQIQDITIKFIICFLVNGVSDFIKSALMSKILASNKFEQLLEECEKDFKQRDEMIATCEELEGILNDIQSF